MTEVLMDYDDVVADIALEPEHRRRFRWTLAVAGAIAIAALAGSGWFAATSGLGEHVISGTATANPTAVVEAAADRKAQALADQKAADEAYLTSLETQVRQDMQEYFDDPANALYLPITVSKVGLIEETDNKYEGTATMQAGTYSAHQIAIHVTADGRSFMWQTDPGALLPLFR